MKIKNKDKEQLKIGSKNNFSLRSVHLSKNHLIHDHELLDSPSKMDTIVVCGVESVCICIWAQPISIL